MPAPEGNQYALGNEGGRPTKYKPEYAEQAYKLALLGLSDEEMAKYFEVTDDTFRNWQAAYQEFLVSVHAGKDMADSEIAAAFYKRAKGYTYEEVTYEKIDSAEQMGVDDEGAIGETKADIFRRKVVTKHLPPDAGAALNWLKNRQKEKWRDNHELTGAKGAPLIPGPQVIIQQVAGLPELKQAEEDLSQE